MRNTNSNQRFINSGKDTKLDTYYDYCIKNRHLQPILTNNGLTLTGRILRKIPQRTSKEVQYKTLITRKSQPDTRRTVVPCLVNILLIADSFSSNIQTEKPI